MSCCSELPAVDALVAETAAAAPSDQSCPCRHPGATDRLVVEVDARDGLVHLERIVCLLRARNHPVVGVCSDLWGETATVAVWGEGLHGGDDEALVLLRLRRLPGVLRAWVDAPVAQR